MASKKTMWTSVRLSIVIAAITGIVLPALAYAYITDRASDELLNAYGKDLVDVHRQTSRFLLQVDFSETQLPPYCSMVDDPAYHDLALAHALCINQKFTVNQPESARYHLHKAINSIDARLLAQLIWYSYDAVEEAGPGFSKELRCMDSLKSQLQKAGRPTLKSYLPSLYVYRLFVSPGISYGEACQFDEKLTVKPSIAI